jgi:acyl carrier protein
MRGLGLLVAGRLAEKGAGRLILMGRRKPDAEALSLIRKIEESGCRVDLVEGDVSSLSDLRPVFGGIEAGYPLKGIFHCAGTLSDGVLAQQTWERFAAVMKAKVTGAWNLHLLSAGLPLDLFVLFSSAVSVIGSPGQTNHAAACAFEDGLARFRTRRGLPGASIAWGPWTSVGAAAGREILSRWEGQGIFPISPEKGLQALEKILSGTGSGVTVLNAAWPEFKRFRREWAGSGFFSELGDPSPSDAPPAPGESGKLLSRVKGAAGPERAKLVRRFVDAAIRRVLELDAAFAIDPKQGLSDLGMDSLLSVELKNRLQRETGLSLPATLAFDFPTPEALARLLSEKLPGSDPERFEKNDEDTSEAGEIGALSDEEAEALLFQELSMRRSI